ncbi:MAG: hypothetical protein K5829_02210 [Treponema sp.]|nr:hypothetical protein [Treponema sp.]
MKFRKSEYYPEIISLYKEISSLNEAYDLKVPHSQEWKSIFQNMEKATKKSAKYMWPYIYKLIEENKDSIEFEYSVSLIKILKYYKAQKGSFDKYFICVLGNDIYKQKTKINIEKVNEDRLFTLSKTAQKKINACLSIIKKYNREHPDENAIKLEDEKAKRLFMERNIFKTEKSMNKYLRLNYESLNKDTQDKLNDVESSYGDKKYYSKNAAVSLIGISEDIPEFLQFLDKCYKKKIKVKKQNDKAQIKKEEFLRKVLTCHYYTKFSKTQDFLEDWNLLSFVKGKSFISNDILNLFLLHEKKIKNITKELKELYKEINISKISEIKSLLNNKSENANKNDLKNYIKYFEKEEEIEKLMKTKPTTVEKISLESGKNFNYGYRVIRDFKNFLKKEAESNNLQAELINLI